MKRVFISLCCSATLVFHGCGSGTNNNKLDTESKNDITSSLDSKKLDGQKLISYMYANKDAKLNASDCLKFSAQEWHDIYGEIIYKMAPAADMARSVDSCVGVKGAVENGYSLAQASRESIKQGWLNGIVTEVDNTNSSGYKRINLTLQKCRELYDGFTQAQWAQETGYGDDKPVAFACYQALEAGPRLGIDGQSYIDAYNNGAYDSMANVNNF